jgi:hypothetical protein
VIKQFSDALERIFRYMLSGVWILIVARLSHPSFFACIHYDQSWQLILLAIIAFCAGNVWYVFHRYTVHQVIDRLAYWRTKARLRGYRKWLIEHVAKSFRLREERPELCRPLEMRAAHIIFMFIVCETVFIAACWHEQYSWFAKIGSPIHWVKFAAIILFLVATWQYFVLFDVDTEIVSEARHASRSGEMTR